MKRTLVLGVIVVAVVFGLVAYATAATQGDVTVSATLNSLSELTIVDSAVDFGAVDPGTTQTSATTPQVIVKSNVPYAYTENVITGSSDLDSYISIASAVNQGTEGARGVFKKTYTFTLDLTPDSAYEIVPGAYTTTYQYTMTP